MSRFRTLLNLAVKLEWMPGNPFRSYKIRYKYVDRGFLTNAEIEKIEARTFQNERIQYVKDLFIFACYTGLAYIDAINLKPENIHIGSDGKKWIFTNRIKTTTPVKVSILPKAQYIIDQYLDHPRSKYYGTIFPKISNQKLNNYLKEVADLCGIDERLTFHLVRHTFATTITLCNGVPIETVSKLLGHTDISTTQI